MEQVPVVVLVCSILIALVFGFLAGVNHRPATSQYLRERCEDGIPVYLGITEDCPGGLYVCIVPEKEYLEMTEILAQGVRELSESNHKLRDRCQSLLKRMPPPISNSHFVSNVFLP